MGNMKNQEQWAIFLAAICGQTYDQFISPSGSFLLPFDYQISYTIEAKSISSVMGRIGFIVESPQEIIIAFRGTSSTTDWISDMIASQKRFPYILEDSLTHRGFTEMYSSARAGIMTVLSKLSPDKTLYITGHSLGGALATLCAIDIAANTPFTSLSLYTFGSPRVGNPAFTDAFKKHVKFSYRYANIFDVVTHAPPFIYKLPKRDKKYFYRHVHSLIALNFNNGSVSANHIIGSYFEELSKLQPEFTKKLCSRILGFCPITVTDSEVVI